MLRSKNVTLSFIDVHTVFIRDCKLPTILFRSPTRKNKYCFAPRKHTKLNMRECRLLRGNYNIQHTCSSKSLTHSPITRGSCDELGFTEGRQKWRMELGSIIDSKVTAYSLLSRVRRIKCALVRTRRVHKYFPKSSASAKRCKVESVEWNGVKRQGCCLLEDYNGTLHYIVASHNTGMQYYDLQYGRCLVSFCIPNRYCSLCTVEL